MRLRAARDFMVTWIGVGRRCSSSKTHEYDQAHDVLWNLYRIAVDESDTAEIRVTNSAGECSGDHECHVRFSAYFRTRIGSARMGTCQSAAGSLS